MLNRRRFLKSSAFISLTPAFPTFLARTILAESAATTSNDNGRILVVVQLDGGNDGINTVVPFDDEGYAKHRREIRLPEQDLIKLDGGLALHPNMRRASELFTEDRLSIVHGVGYPNPNRSHFQSMNIWHSGSVDLEQRALGNGWIGDAISLQKHSNGPHAIHVGDEQLPLALHGRRCAASTISNRADLRLTLAELSKNTSAPISSATSILKSDAGSSATDATTDATSNHSLADFVSKSVNSAYATTKELAETTKEDTGPRYPGNKLGTRFQLVSQMIKSNAAARVYYTSQGGYDTHAVQLRSHGQLLGELSSALKAFMDDMHESGLEDRVLVMAFSEFGRRVKENDSLGTDHGTAGPVILAGTKLATRVYGTMPSLLDLNDGDLKYTTDFRCLYSAILTDWLQIETPQSLQPHKWSNQLIS